MVSKHIADRELLAISAKINMNKLKSEYGISRMDNARNGTHGWMVTIQRRNVIHRRSFSDGRFGGKEQSLVAARVFRDEVIAKYPTLDPGESSPIVNRDNSSCVIGLCRYCVSETRNLPEKQQRWYWVASCPTADGKPKRVKFSENKYGEEQAFKLALKARREALRALEGRAPARDVHDAGHASSQRQTTEKAAQSSTRGHWVSPPRRKSIHSRVSDGSDFRRDPE